MRKMLGEYKALREKQTQMVTEAQVPTEEKATRQKRPGVTKARIPRAKTRRPPRGRV
jgi:hypothetical protein